jgi:hypothetical protein
MDKIDDATDGFHRQRRNLILGSITVLFVEIAGIRLNADAGVFGFSFAIHKPETMSWFLWIAVFYWLVRFYQYHRVRIPTGFVEHAQSVYFDYLREHAIESIRATVPEVLPNRPSDVEAGERCELRPFNFALKKRTLWTIEGQCTPAWQVWHGDDLRAQHDSHETGVVFRGLTLFMARLRGYWRAVAHTPLFTDYGLPYLVFLALLVVKGYLVIVGEQLLCLSGCE